MTNLLQRVPPARTRVHLCRPHCLLGVGAQCALKCADLGHLALPEELHRDWVSRLEEEFFLQGDQERKAGLPISPLMDRTKANSLFSSQVLTHGSCCR